MKSLRDKYLTDDKIHERLRADGTGDKIADKDRMADKEDLMHLEGPFTEAAVIKHLQTRLHQNKLQVN